MYRAKCKGLAIEGDPEWFQNPVAWQKSYQDALSETEAHFTRKGLEIATIANPENGNVFFQKCISFNGWGVKNCKLNPFRASEIAQARVSPEE